MAQNKKSFILYSDLLYTIEQMPKDKAGELFVHILKYVNDQNPISNDLIINLTFEPIKQQLKRDLKHWESIKCKRSEAGKASAEKRQQNKQMSTNVKSVEQNSTNSTVNDNVNVNVNVSDNVNVNDKIKYKEIDIIDVKKYFIENGYSENSAQKFFDYYSVANWKDSNGKKVKNWKQKAQSVWFKPENKINQLNSPKMQY